jgi:hypothetical protein
MGRINRGDGMTANPSGVYPAGELSLASADGSHRQEFGRALSRARARPFRRSILLNGPWPWQGKALPFGFSRKINGNSTKKAVHFTIRHTGGTQMGSKK